MLCISAKAYALAACHCLSQQSRQLPPLCPPQRKDWLCLVAVHSDTWLLSMAFYAGARLNRESRERLFELINDLPTVSSSAKSAAAW